MLRLDNDFYNLTMGQVAWRHYPRLVVKYSLFNRSPVKLGSIDLKALELLIENYRSAKITDEDLKYLASLRVFDPEYLEYLQDSQELPKPTIKVIDDQLHIEYEGPWTDAIMLETPILAMINQLWAETYAQNETWQEGTNRLVEKIDWLIKNPYIRFFEFGTRRRHAWDWQVFVLGALSKANRDQLLGTSNVWLSKALKIPVRGTMAHQLFMCLTALYGDPAIAQQEALWLWEEEWGQTWDGHLLVALTDTYGTEFFLEGFDHRQAQKWYGFRQDSGDPVKFGNRILEFWHQHNIDPQTKLLAFSDGLTPELMTKLYDKFGSKTNVVFGWGTNLTNDLGIDPISIVIKPVAVRVGSSSIWKSCCKLSDNPAKATGDQAKIAELRELVGYRNAPSIPVVY